VDPAFLLLDEPTAHQDECGLDAVVAAIGRSREKNAVVVVATHDPRLLECHIADAIWSLGTGRLGRQT
jgi:ABC-type protease/lipase transport system fused ATPase/permease subunit